jgi:hypothetical protein
MNNTNMNKPKFNKFIFELKIYNNYNFGIHTVKQYLIKISNIYREM